MPFDAATYTPPVVDPLSLTTPRERLIYLRDFLRELPAERFNISDLFTQRGRFAHPIGSQTVGQLVADCGTAACIAGWTSAIFRADERGDTGSWDSFAAQIVLGLTIEQREALFCPPRYDTPWGSKEYTLPRAVQVLDHLIATGEVDWSVARRES